MTPTVLRLHGDCRPGELRPTAWVRLARLTVNGSSSFTYSGPMSNFLALLADQLRELETSWGENLYHPVNVVELVIS